MKRDEKLTSHVYFTYTNWFQVGLGSVAFGVGRWIPFRRGNEFSILKVSPGWSDFLVIIHRRKYTRSQFQFFS